MSEQIRAMIPEGHDVLSYGLVIKEHRRRRDALRAEMSAERERLGLGNKDVLILDNNGISALVEKMVRRLG
jgi:hypothetical protein